jgi:hypothetical protein
MPDFRTGMTSYGGGGSSGTLTGAPPFNWDPTFGGQPQVPAPGATAGTAIGSNIGNLGSLYNLAGGINQFNTQALQGGLAAGLPGYQGMLGQSSANIMSNLNGQLPPDVLALISQQGAERGIATGSPGSANSNAAYLRALGLTSLGLQQTGEQELTGAIGRTPVAQPFNLSSMLTTPEQNQEAAMAANLYRSAPVPRNAATAGIGAFNSGMGAGAGAFGPSVNYGGGGLGFGGAGDPFMSMYNAPDFGGYSGGPLQGSGTDPGGGAPGPQAYNNWFSQFGGLGGTTMQAGGGGAPASPFEPTGNQQDYMPMGMGEGQGGLQTVDELLGAF